VLLEMSDVSVYYERVEALKSVSLTLEEGSIIAILGANGAGKSTLIKTISGVKHPTRGQISFAGQRINQFPPQRIFAIGIVQVPEGRRLFPWMSVRENLLIGANALKNASRFRERLEEVCVHFPVLRDRLNQHAGTLSGGEQQMVAIGRALIGDPKLMVLDEPSLGLAPIMVKELFLVLKHVNEKGTSVLLAEQNAKQALRLVEKAYVLEAGKIAISGKAEEIANNEVVKEAYLGG